MAKDALFDAFASVAQALGSGRRAEIVDVLAQGERSVDEVAGEIGQSLANTSHHLRLLARPAWCGRVVMALGSSIGWRATGWRSLWAAVRDVAARHVAEVSVLAGEYLGDRDGVEQVSAEELAERLARGQVVVLDVRPEAEYRAGHIAGAVRRRWRRSRRSCRSCRGRGEVVAYCRGPYCVYADDAVRLLQARGVRARRLDVGFPEWRRAGLHRTRPGAVA